MLGGALNAVAGGGSFIAFPALLSAIMLAAVAGPGMVIGVYNCGGALYAIEDRCSHDDGPLAEGPFDADACTVECPRHGSLFDLKTGRPKSLPAYQPVDTFPVIIDDDMIKLEVD